ncbi:outer membrane protein assembly factor BamE [Lactiplantibacillus pentosus]|uniref:outer membrane protein assembly factor BamE n=1 Tax=Lactiplantibacillus pentosus TaxID=1589 RepID=UPI001CDC2FF6|nr:outer membrane protein assembly factor BamE [Lactiplantibacillus pentosus]
MDTFAEIMFFISLLITIYFICQGIFKLIKGGGVKQSFKYGLIALAASLLFVIVGIIANPVKTTTSHQDRIAKAQTSRTSKKHTQTKSADKSASKKQSSKSNSKKANSKKSASHNSSTKKASSKKSASHKSSTKKTSSKKSVSHKSNSKKASSKKSASHKSSTKKQPSKSSQATKKTMAQKSSSKHESKSKKATKRHYNFSKIKLGMTKSQVIAILGKPTDQNSSTLIYGSADLDFDDDKLFDGSPRKIHKAANKKAKAEAKKASRKKVNANQLKSFAKAFGQKDVETLQRNVGIAYSSTETPQGMAYGWKTNYGMLYRLDDSETGLTHVYKGGLGDDGTELYVGQTIKQKQRRSYYYY